MIKMINKKAKVLVQGPLTSCFLYSPLLGNDWTGESHTILYEPFWRKEVWLIVWSWSFLLSVHPDIDAGKGSLERENPKWFKSWVFGSFGENLVFQVSFAST